MSDVTKEELCARVTREVAEMASRLEGVDEELFLKPVGTGEWTLRDLLSHLLFWQKECLWALKSTLEGTYERRDYSDVDKTNAAGVESLKDLKPLEVIAQLKASGVDIAETIKIIPEDLWETKPRLAAWVHGSVTHHYEEHTPDIISVIGT
ncbi:MAG: maleylpyruvate isomerase N-terminal domain-containing protein [Actinomycetota bacterium]